MTRLHKIGIYKDGYKLVEYCRVCSAEGIDLGDDCPGNFPDPVKVAYFKNLTKEEFDEKYKKALDDAKTKSINHRY